MLATHSKNHAKHLGAEKRLKSGKQHLAVLVWAGRRLETLLHKTAYGGLILVCNFI
jgi:hypothetical protein